jgi:hypothetical protein
MKRRARCSITCSISRSAALVRLHSEGTGTHEWYPITLRDHEDLNLMSDSFRWADTLRCRARVTGRWLTLMHVILNHGRSHTGSSK